MRFGREAHTFRQKVPGRMRHVKEMEIVVTPA
jgi:hypothetical protein